MTLLDVIDKIEQHRPEPFVAPVPDAESVVLFSLQRSIPYWFRLRNPEPGWWIAEPSHDGRNASLGCEASPWQYLSYLQNLPRFYVLTLFRLAAQTWLCIPYNAADAAQRGWPYGTPRPIHVVRDAIGSLNLVSVRLMGGTLLYEGLDWRGLRHSIPADTTRNAERLLEEQAAVLARLLAERELQAQLAEQEAARATTEGEMRYQLNLMGANLLDWSEQGEDFRVSWSHEGQEYSMTVGRNLMIRSAGLCLAGTDSHHDLATIVGVMQRSRSRYDDEYEEGW